MEMGIKGKRSNIKYGRYSRALILPAPLEKGEKSTLAGDRLLLVDPRGEISEEDLLEFLERFVEPRFWLWYQEKQGVAQNSVSMKRAEKFEGIR